MADFWFSKWLDIVMCLAAFTPQWHCCCLPVAPAIGPPFWGILPIPAVPSALHLPLCPLGHPNKASCLIPPSSLLPCRPNSKTPLHLGPASLLCFYLLGQTALTFHICFKAVMQWHQREQYNLRWSLRTLIKHAISSMSPLSSSLPCLGYGTLKSSWAQVCLPTALREKSEYHSIYFQTDQKQQRVQIWVQNVPSSVPFSHCLEPALYRQHELFTNYP